MVRSMTGYGRGECCRDGKRATVELRSVNNRYLDCTVKMPRSYLFAEETIKERVQSRVARGKVDVLVTVVQDSGEACTVTVNEPLALAYLGALRRLEQLGEGRLALDCRAIDLARMPEVLAVEKLPEDRSSVQALLLDALDGALEDFDAMRCREGGRMMGDIQGRADIIQALVERIEGRSPHIVSEYRQRLERKMREVLGAVQVDEGRLLTEAAIFADKVAVDEETVRLRSHLAQLRELLGQGGAVGRKLDFLIQEFNREANTIGSKCSDVENSRTVVDLKAEIEKIREQVQNLE